MHVFVRRLLKYLIPGKYLHYFFFFKNKLDYNWIESLHVHYENKKVFIKFHELKNNLEQDTKYFHFWGMIILFSPSIQLSYNGVEIVTVNI